MLHFFFLPCLLVASSCYCYYQLCGYFCWVQNSLLTEVSFHIVKISQLFFPILFLTRSLLLLLCIPLPKIMCLLIIFFMILMLGFIEFLGSEFDGNYVLVFFFLVFFSVFIFSWFLFLCLHLFFYRIESAFNPIKHTFHLTYCSSFLPNLFGV